MAATAHASRGRAPGGRRGTDKTGRGHGLGHGLVLRLVVHGLGDGPGPPPRHGTAANVVSRMPAVPANPRRGGSRARRRVADPFTLTVPLGTLIFTVARQFHTASKVPTLDGLAHVLGGVRRATWSLPPLLAKLFEEGQLLEQLQRVLALGSQVVGLF